MVDVEKVRREILSEKKIHYTDREIYAIVHGFKKESKFSRQQLCKIFNYSLKTNIYRTKAKKFFNISDRRIIIRISFKNPCTSYEYTYTPNHNLIFVPYFILEKFSIRTYKRSDEKGIVLIDKNKLPWWTLKEYGGKY